MAGKLRIVLVEPREAGNVGAAARAMKNFGFSELVLVGQLPSLVPVAHWWSSGAEEIVSQARVQASLPAALADCHLTVATTSARGRGNQPELDPAGVSSLFGELDDHQTLAIVFGREDRGLDSQETALCQRAASIPSSPAFPTMNLAQSVSIFCYELSRTGVLRPAVPRDLAPAEMIERIHQEARRLLLDAGFLHENNPDRIYDDLRAVLGRAGLDPREATILLGIIRQLKWKIGSQEGI